MAIPDPQFESFIEHFRETNYFISDFDEDIAFKHVSDEA